MRLLGSRTFGFVMVVVVGGGCSVDRGRRGGVHFDLQNNRSLSLESGLTHSTIRNSPYPDRHSTETIRKTFIAHVNKKTNVFCSSGT